MTEITDNSKNFDNLKEKNQQVLNNISQLQEQEQKLYDSLSNENISPEEKKQIINKINELSQMRLNMYSSMKDMYSFYTNNASSSENTLEMSMTAIDILENELNDAKARMNLLDDQKSNKMRLVQINTYYGKRYGAHTKIMQIIVFMCIPLIILAVLANKGILPPKIYVVLSGIVIIIGVTIIGLQIIDISNRSNMNWDEYNLYFDKSTAPTDTTDIYTTEKTSDPWTSSESVSAACIGSACCVEGTTYDETKSLCVINTPEGFRGLDYSFIK
jgi:hypothetical protein